MVSGDGGTLAKYAVTAAIATKNDTAIIASSYGKFFSPKHNATSPQKSSAAGNAHNVQARYF